jgi:Holliday junction resolvasome RuvABC endonuclease subunit
VGSRKKAPAAESIPSGSVIRSLPISEMVHKVEKSRVDLALDLSTSCVGWALGVDKQIITWGKIVFKTTAELGEKLVALEECLRVLFETYRPGRLFVEKPLARRGNTTHRHYEVLGVVKKLWRETTDTELLDSWLVSSVTVKNKLRVKRGSNHEHNKELMVKKINDLLGLKLSYHPNSKRQSDDDIADAIAVLIAVWRKG